jgi:DNA-binding GntR family transcriptional regulator
MDYHWRVVDNSRSRPYNCRVSARIMQTRSIPDCGLARHAYATILERIVHGDYAIGQLISRRTVARDLGISFLPASEALLRLEHEGFVESRPRAGTRIRIPSRLDAEGHFLVTEALEVQAAIMFASNATASERAELIKLAARLDAEGNKQSADPLEYLPLHDRLHLKIAECARCDALDDVLKRQSSLTSAWLCATKAIVSGNDRPKHEPLIRGLARQKPCAAAEIMRAHVRAEAEQALHSLEAWFDMNKKHLQTYSRSVARKPVPVNGGAVPAVRTDNVSQSMRAMPFPAL